MKIIVIKFNSDSIEYDYDSLLMTVSWIHTDLDRYYRIDGPSYKFWTRNGHSGIANYTIHYHRPYYKGYKITKG